MAAKRLGRGLDFLLTSAEGDESPGAAQEVDVRAISSNPWQPRTEFADEGLEELAQSIRRHGVVQPIVIRPTVKGGYELVAGERRLLASKRAGLKAIPAIVRDVEDSQMLTLALVENVQRQDLDPVERARAFRRLVAEQGLTHQQVAEVAGLARSTVSNSLRLLDLEPEYLTAVSTGRISEGHARALLAEANGSRRQDLFQGLVEGHLSVRDAEEMVSSAELKQAPGEPRKSKTSEAKALEARLSDLLDTQVLIQERGTRGRIILRYRTLKEFDRLYEKLAGERPDV